MPATGPRAGTPGCHSPSRRLRKRGLCPAGLSENKDQDREYPMKVASLLLLASASVLTPISEQVPNLNVAPSCRGAAEIRMADSQSYDACMKDENTARDQLLQSWQSFAAADRASCAADALSTNITSYVELLVCLQIASKFDPEKHTKLTGARRK